MNVSSLKESSNNQKIVSSNDSSTSFFGRVNSIKFNQIPDTVFGRTSAFSIFCYLHTAALLNNIMLSLLKMDIMEAFILKFILPFTSSN